MSGFDLVIIGIFIVSILIGVLRGLIKEALSVTSWIMAIWLASTFNAQVGDWFAQYVSIPNATFRIWIGFCIVFVATLFAFALISFLISKLIVRGPIKGTDRFLGIFFGAARAALIIVAIMMLARGLGRDESDWWKNSQYLPYFLPLADYIEPMVFDNLPDAEETKGRLNQAVMDQAIKNAKSSTSTE